MNNRTNVTLIFPGKKSEQVVCFEGLYLDQREKE